VEGNTVEGEVDGRIGAGTEYHCAHGGGEISVFTVLDTRPNEYITMMVPFTQGTAFRYTSYVIPNGTGTRIVTFAAAPTSVDTGETVPELADAGTAELVLGTIQGPTARLIELADEAAESLSAAPV
jgi:hypothetical protein